MTKEEFINCVLYIEDNPVREGLGSTLEVYLFSSAAGGTLDAMPVHLSRK
jgi:hypothetical protein